MDLANPLYDAAFKYLMEDKRVATLIIGTITELEIVDINLCPTEVTLCSLFDQLH